MARKQLILIGQALASAVSSINMAKQLLREIEEENREDTKAMPGITGKFEGEFMAGSDGKKYPVSENYASKSLLVYGDTLKMVEEDGRPFFKQIDRVKRLSVNGILAKKDGKWHAVTSDGSYGLLSAGVAFHNGREGDEVVVIIPAENKRVPFAAFEKMLNERPKEVVVVPEGPVEVLKKPVEKEKVVKEEKEEKPVEKVEKPKAKKIMTDELR
jgi:hypothetical protein